MLNNLARSVALCLSIASGVISVFGLASIFSGSYWSVIGVAAFLEIAKIVTAAWMDRYWFEITKTFKVYFVAAVLILMAITSMGIYGFFARAHIEQQVQLSTGETSKLPVIQNQIGTEKAKIADLDKQLAQIDDSLAAMTSKGKRTSEVKQALDEAKRQRAFRNDLVNEKAIYQNKIAELENEKNKLENVQKKQEVEVGPLKYLANVFYGGKATPEDLEHAVRLFILVLVVVFDPLAIMLLVAANHQSRREKDVLEYHWNGSNVVTQKSKSALDLTNHDFTKKP